jgi:hypothetical protein
MANQNGDVGKLKQALDKQNKLERASSATAKHRRDAAEGDAAHHGLGVLEKHSKGRPKQEATAKKSPQASRSQSR